MSHTPFLSVFHFLFIDRISQARTGLYLSQLSITNKTIVVLERYENTIFLLLKRFLKCEETCNFSFGFQVKTKTNKPPSPDYATWYDSQIYRVRDCFFSPKLNSIKWYSANFLETLKYAILNNISFKKIHTSYKDNILLNDVCFIYLCIYLCLSTVKGRLLKVETFFFFF